MSYKKRSLILFFFLFLYLSLSSFPSCLILINPFLQKYMTVFPLISHNHPIFPISHSLWSLSVDWTVSSFSISNIFEALRSALCVIRDDFCESIADWTILFFCILITILIHYNLFKVQYTLSVSFNSLIYLCSFNLTLIFNV